MWIARRAGAWPVLLSLLIGAVAVVGAACGESSTSTPTSPVFEAIYEPTTTVSFPPPAGADTIAVNYVDFFDGTRPVADKIGLLENGEQYEQELEAQAASPLGKTVSISISSVTITSPTTADVTFSLLLDGEPAFPDQTGQAILQNEVWKVGAETFLAVLALQQGSTTQSS
jgi:hypothetical protein